MPITDSSAPAPRIICTSQQSRFHAETLDTSLDVDLKDVSISIEQNELVEASHLRLKAGVRYALVARNGAGKSTLMRCAILLYACSSCTNLVVRAIADKLIPGLSVSLRVLMLSQVEDTIRGQAAEASVLEHVLQGDHYSICLDAF
jgi:ATP-binding cassette subfamily F protein 3